MEINKDTFEAMLVLLFKLEEAKACEELFSVYVKIFGAIQMEEEKGLLH